MEASVAADGQAAEQQEGQQEQQAPSVDFSPVLSQFEGMRGELEAMRSQLAAQQPAEEERGEDELAGLDFLNIDPSAPDFDPEAMQRGIADAIQRAAQEAAAPAMERAVEIERRMAAAALVSEFPEIGETETAQNVVAGAGQLAQQIGQDLGLQALGLPPQISEQIVARMAASPALWRATYLGSKGTTAAQAETPADAAEAHLEGGAGSRPGASQEPDPASLIVGAGGPGVLPY